MLTLQELSEQGAALQEQCVRESQAIDYAWLADQVAIAQDKPAHHLHDWIERQLAELLGEIDNVDSNSGSPGGSGAGGNTGTDPQA